MRWHAQVAHVGRKDLRLVRWHAAAYAGVVAEATASAVGWGAFAPGAPSLWSSAPVLLGMAVAALLVQADSPARADAFWATLPLRPSAVCAAKLLVAVTVLLALPLLGQLAGLLAHAVAPADVPGLLAESALTYGAWLCLAAVAAALTPDFRGFVVAAILAALGWAVGSQVVWWLGGASAAGGAPPPLLVPAVATGGALLLLGHQYLTRDVRRGAWIAGLLGGVVLVLPLLAARPVRSVPAAAGAVPDHLRRVALGIYEVRLRGGSETEVMLRVDGGSEHHVDVLVSPVVRVRMADGSAVAVAAEDHHVRQTLSFAQPADGFRWLGERPSSGTMIVPVSVALPAAQRAAIAEGSARLALEGRVEVQEPRLRAALPLRAGAAAAGGGRRMRVVGVQAWGEGVAVELQESSVAPSRSFARADDPHGPRSFALVNRERGEALALGPGSRTGNRSGLVLPGPGAQVQTWQLTSQLPDDSGVRIGADWLERAHLLLFDWAPVGSYPILVVDTGRGTGRRER